MNPRLVLFGAALVTLFPVSRLPAQDVTVGEIGWFSSDGVPEQPPQAKRQLRVDYPEELRESGEVGYVIIYRCLDADGRGLNLRIRGSDRLFQRAVAKEVRDWPMRPARLEGRSVPAQFWLPVIFNPASASPDRPDATPRLLAVTPIILKTRTPGDDDGVWATVSLDAAGTPVTFDLESPAYRELLPEIEAGLKHWRFAPARQGGRPTAASVRVALLFYPPMTPVPAKLIPPRAVYQVKPVYPQALAANEIKGEVRLEFFVDRTGQVVDPVVVQSNNPAFNEPAIAALLKWKFEPGRVDGRPVPTRMMVPMVFQIEGGGGREAFTVTSPGRKAQGKLPEELRYDTPPKPRGTVNPVYPYGLLRDDREGRVTVAFAVNTAGDVVETKIVAATRPEFGLALVAAVESFKFDPALKNGRPVEAAIRIEQVFDPFLPGQIQILTDADRSLLRRERKHPGTIVSAHRLDAPLKPLSRRPPVFPLALRNTVNAGSATIEVLIDEDGRVRLPRLVEASDPAFGYAAVQAAAEWLFEPPRSGGKPAVVRVRIPFAFDMKHAAPDDAASQPPPVRDGK